MLRKGYGGLYNAPTKEERRKRRAERRESDQAKFIDLRFEYSVKYEYNIM